MKKFVKGRWFPLIAVAIASVIVALVMALFGWKITYAPDLENSWDAISACAAWMSAMATLDAVIVAIIIAIKQNKIAQKQTEISEQQNKIVLFEKRYEFYQMVRDCLSLARFLPQFGDSKNNIYIYSFAQDVIKI